MPRDLISPADLEADRSFHVVDVRPWFERHGPLGYVPGSRCFERAVIDPLPLRRAYPGGPPLALVCSTGRRSSELLAQVRGAGFTDVRCLAGGVLGWRSAGLPACGVSAVAAEQIPALAALEQLPRVLAASFLAETAANHERSLGAAFDPAAVVSSMLADEVDVPSSSLEISMLYLLDRTAEMARLRGHPTDRIAASTDRLRAAISRLGGPPSSRRLLSCVRAQ